MEFGPSPRAPPFSVAKGGTRCRGFGNTSDWICATFSAKNGTVPFSLFTGVLWSPHERPHCHVGRTARRRPKLPPANELRLGDCVKSQTLGGEGLLLPVTGRALTKNKICKTKKRTQSPSVRLSRGPAQPVLCCLEVGRLELSALRLARPLSSPKYFLKKRTQTMPVFIGFLKIRTQNEPKFASKTGADGQ